MKLQKKRLKKMKMRRNNAINVLFLLFHMTLKHVKIIKVRCNKYKKEALHIGITVAASS